ncbi:MAG: hypothetical protein PHW75_00085 [Patescibacteria group bacterium]|nr:hypothetical protein [Patescibacteria group bacterium]
MEHKAQSLIISSGVFLLLLLPLRFPSYFWPIIITVSLASALSVFWVFGEKPSFARLKEDWFAIVFLFVFIMSLSIFSYTLPHPFFQAILLGTTGFFVYYILQVASRIKRNYTPSLFLRNVITLASILAIFFATSDAVKWSISTDDRLFQILSIVLVFASVFVICEFLFEIQGYERPLLYSLVISFMISQIVWLSSFWVVTYPQTEKATNIGVPLPAILSAVYFYLFWGISHHRLEGTLSRRILWEYTIIAFFFTVILIATAQWLPQ